MAQSASQLADQSINQSTSLADCDQPIDLSSELPDLPGVQLANDDFLTMPILCKLGQATRDAIKKRQALDLGKARMWVCFERTTGGRAKVEGFSQSLRLRATCKTLVVVVSIIALLRANGWRNLEGGSVFASV